VTGHDQPAASTPRRDPRVRKDGLRAGCHKPRTKKRTKATGPTTLQPNATRLAKHLWLYELEKDPFCSARCARKFHGTQLASDTDQLTEVRTESGRKSAARFKKAAA
jgi:hypothetical protein